MSSPEDLTPDDAFRGILPHQITAGYDSLLARAEEPR